MGWIQNAVNTFKIGFKGIKHTSNQVFGMAKKYTISQNRYDIPFEQGYAKSSDIYSIVRKITNNAKTVPWVLKKQTGEDIEVINSGELYDIIQNPNPNQSRSEYTEQGLNQLLIGGNVFFNSVVPVGFKVPQETYLLHPQLTEIQTKQEGKFIKPNQYIYRINGSEFKIPAEEITHLKYCNPTDYGIQTLRGLSPLIAGTLSMVGITSNQTANASILENQATSGIISNEGEYTLTPDEQKAQQDILDKQLGNSTDFGQILQSTAKIKFIKLGLDPSQLKIIESKILMVRDLCNIWDVNSILFGDPAGSTYNNIIEAKKSLWTGPVKSSLESFVSYYEKEVVFKYNEKEFPSGNSRYFIDLDFSSIEELQVDKKEEAAKDKIVADGIKVIMEMPISSSAKMSLLVDQYGLTPTQAELIVTPEGTRNKTLEKLSAMSPLLANKLLEKMSDEEVRALLN